MSTLRQVDSFGIVLPEQWTSVPTELHAFEEFCNRARERWRQLPLFDRAFERRADTMLNRLRHELASAGVILAAVFIEEVVDDTVEPGHAPSRARAADRRLHARRLHQGRPGDRPVAVGAGAVQRLHPQAARRGAALRADHRRRPARPVPLPAGRAVHLRRLYEPRRFGMELADFFAESFVLPIGTDGEACCVLQFATTNVEQSRRFSELFGAIAATFRMFRPDDPTEFYRAHRGDRPHFGVRRRHRYRRSHLAPAGQPVTERNHNHGHLARSR